MAFAKEILKLKRELEYLGHIVTIPHDTENYVKNKVPEEKKWIKIEHDLIKGYFNEIKKTDAVLIANYDKNNIKGYIGGNSLIELAFGYVLNKKIFLLNQVPKLAYSDEIEAMQPIVLNRDLRKIK